MPAIRTASKDSKGSKLRIPAKKNHADNFAGRVSPEDGNGVSQQRNRNVGMSRSQSGSTLPKVESHSSLASTEIPPTDPIPRSSSKVKAVMRQKLSIPEEHEGPVYRLNSKDGQTTSSANFEGGYSRNSSKESLWKKNSRNPLPKSGNFIADPLAGIAAKAARRNKHKDPLSGGDSTLSVGLGLDPLNGGSSAVLNGGPSQVLPDGTLPALPGAPGGPRPRISFRNTLSNYDDGIMETMFLEKVIDDDVDWVVQALSKFGKELLNSEWAGGLCRTSILYAAKAGHQEMCKVLLAYGGTELLNVKDLKSRDAQHFAAQHDPPMNLKTLMQSGLRIDCWNFSVLNELEKSNRILQAREAAEKRVQIEHNKRSSEGGSGGDEGEKRKSAGEYTAGGNY